MKYKKWQPVLVALYLIATNGLCTTAIAQNLSFEEGLKDWSTIGNVTIDNSNALKGNNCIKIGNGSGAVMQRVPARPFSIVNFEAFVRLGGVGAKGYSFLRFFDSANALLLEYKSKPLSSVSYVSTGNYTESPPFTKYIVIGIEKDSSSEVLYADNFKIETNVNEPLIKHPPLCNLNQYLVPFWKSDTIYNETVLMYSENGKAAKGRLLFNPTKILSVKSFDLKATYKWGKDFSIKDNVITMLKNSKMPFATDSSFEKEKNLAWYDIQSKWVVITYRHKDKWNGPVPSYRGNDVPNTIAKLKARAPLKIVAYGMSITRGMDVSGYDTVSPYMPPYVDLFSYGLQKKYGYGDIIMFNAGLPGAAVDWAAEHAGEYLNPLNADLVILDFGMNDFWRITPKEFGGYIQTIIDKVKTSNPQAEFILISNMMFDNNYILDSDSNKNFYVSNMKGYNSILKQLQQRGIVNLDMNTLSEVIYKKKKAKDCIVNPLHPNDYLARWYAQAMLALFTPMQKADTFVNSKKDNR